MGRNRVSVVVRRGDLNRALKIFKKAISGSGHLIEFKEKMEFVKPTTKRRERKKKAVWNQQYYNRTNNVGLDSNTKTK